MFNSPVSPRVLDSVRRPVLVLFMSGRDVQAQILMKRMLLGGFFFGRIQDLFPTFLQTHQLTVRCVVCAHDQCLIKLSK